MTFILLTTCAPTPLADGLILAGHRVFEAMAISEALALAEEYTQAQIIITADVEQSRAKVLQRHYPRMQLNENASPADVLWEMALLFPSHGSLTH